MRIGIDGSAILKQPTGIGRYVKSLVRALAEADRDDEFVVLTISYKDSPPEELFADCGNVSVIHKKWPGRGVQWLWERFRWPAVEDAIGAVDLFHSPGNFVLPQSQGRSVTTIHDLYFLRYPEETHKTGGQYHFRVLPKTIGQADHIIAVSESTAEDVKELLHVPEEKVSVIHQGLDERFLKTDSHSDQTGLAHQPPTINHQPPTNRPYILHFGTIEPRKGIDTLVDAMELLWDRHGFDGSLALAGLKGWGCDQLLRRCELLSRRWPLRLTGYVPEENVIPLLSGARLAVVPSKHEGFGLTGLEAMALGVPVLSTRRGALPEVYGDAALYFECGNAEELSQKIAELWADDASRAELICKGKARSALFSWDRTAQETLALYRRLHSEHS